MSKNIIIQEGGVAKQMTADKLKTNLVGGGTCLWVPEDGTMLGTKTITENGTYKASEDGYYGYSEVTVSGIGSATGKDPDGSGDEATAGVDPETGEIVISKLPSSIIVDTPPTKQEYSIGQTIDYSGMVVKAYLQSGGVWADSTHPNGVVPNSELVLPMSTVSGDDVEDKPDEASSDLDISPLPNPIGIVSGGVNYFEYEGSTGNKYTGSYTVTPASGKDVKCFTYSISGADSVARTFFASDQSGALAIITYRRVGYDIYGRQIADDYETTMIDSDKQYTYNGKTVYYKNSGNFVGGVEDNTFPHYTWYDFEKEGMVAWTMIYGNVTPGGAFVKVPVQWPRPGDGSILETSFDITVTEVTT